MIYFITFILTYAIINAKVNQLVIDKKDWHQAQWIKVALLGSAITLGSVYKFDTPSEYFKLLFVFITLYWIVFDLSLNLFRRLKWYYVGTTSKVDKYLTGWSFYFKAIMLFFTILITMYYFK